jgi:Suppressor of fused protein (SUFU)
MFIPKRSKDPCRLELEMYVKEVKKYHIERLTQAAEFPFVEKSYLGHGDTIDWADPIARGSDLEADLIIYSILEDHRELALTIHHGDPVQLLWCVPISSAELEYKLEHGSDALLEVFDEMKHPLVLDVRRKSYV